MADEDEQRQELKRLRRLFIIKSYFVFLGFVLLTLAQNVLFLL